MKIIEFKLSFGNLLRLLRESALMTKRESKGTQCAKWEGIHCDWNCVTCHALYLRSLVICYYTIITPSLMKGYEVRSMLISHFHMLVYLVYL